MIVRLICFHLMHTVTVPALWPGLLIFFFFCTRGSKDTRGECIVRHHTTLFLSPDFPLFIREHRHVRVHIWEPQHPPHFCWNGASSQYQNRHYFTWKKCSISTLLKPCQGKKNRSCDFSMPSGKLDWASAPRSVSAVWKQAVLGLNS